MKKALSINKYQLFLFALLLAGIFTRFYNLSDWLYFTIDEERDAFIMRRIIVEKRPVLIGGSIPGGLYIGPAFYYLSAIIMAFSSLNPIGEAIVASSLGVLSIWLVYKIGEKLFSKQTSIFASIFYTFSYLVTIYNRIYWPLVLAPLISLVVYYLLARLSKKSQNNRKYIYALAIAAIIGVQSDPSNFSTLILAMSFFIVFKIPFNSYVKKGLALFAIAHLPLLLFDIRHNFLNAKALINFFSFGRHTGSFNPLSIFIALKRIPETISRTISISGPLNVSEQINPCIQYFQARANIHPASITAAFFVMGIFIFLFIKNKHKLGYKLIGSHLIIATLGVIIYNLFFPGYTNEWFFYVLFPAFAFMFGTSLSLIWKQTKTVAIFCVGIFIFINLRSFINTTNDFGYKQKAQAINYAIEKIGDKSFYLDSLGSCHSYEGSRYLFWLFGKEPAASYMDPVYGDWLYPHPNLDRKDIPLKVVLVSPLKNETPQFYERYLPYLQKATYKQAFGSIEVLIVDEN